MASEEEEVEWIEQPGGWEGDHESQDNVTGNDVDNNDNNDDRSDESDDDEQGGFGAFDLFANNNPELTFPFDVPLGEGKTAKLKLEGFTLDSDETAQSTGVTLWQAAPRLACYISEPTATKELIRNKSVLELGAGLGLCGMVSHHLGAKKVVLTDADTITLQQMRQNLEANCPGDTTEHSITCRQLIWNNRSQMKDCGTFDTVLGADVIYTIESLDPLFDTVAYFLGNGTQGETEIETESRRSFVLSRYTKYGNISDETVLDAARARNLVWNRPSEGIFVFRQGAFTNSNSEEAAINP